MSKRHSEWQTACEAEAEFKELRDKLTAAQAENEALRGLAKRIRDIAIDSPASNNMKLIYRLACQQADEIERGGSDA